ncbi:MAG: hypothetical protein R3C16_09480 [Hyphomonadaceae bacterium]
MSAWNWRQQAAAVSALAWRADGMQIAVGDEAGRATVFDVS